ncbi:SHOCT-like domain-containing protein [Clostridium cylindrosporum]|uniref:YvlB/LiaX N-terminal domain-containing protein n=1 Tax=Clostridium cylindrosporum DSM 605 TaxID=1121307 RepID=A0A0J8D8Q0_CLOCY|nr:hypothetical protein [Clostridium cylindrosporum]KMT22257.1 hypothetical protein CLCY_4c02300 [Clostridium cylindrosporum DSM 605]
MREELQRVLSMVKEGKLDIEKGSDLIEAMYEKHGAELTLKKYSERMLRVLVESIDGDNVRVNLPVPVITSILRATGKLPIKNEYVEGIDFEALSVAIISALENETLGEIVTVDSSKGDKVRVVVE